MKEVKVYDSFGQQINTLVQWDSDVYIHIKNSEITAAYNVHFFNPEDTMALVVESTYSDGTLTVKVPNDLLTNSKPIVGYIYVTDNNEYRSVYVFNLLVRKRPVPSDFVYVESDDYISTIRVLAECTEYAENAATSASESADSATLSESWAVGGTGTRDGEDTNNSKYYSEQSESSADAASTSESNASDSATLSESWAVGGTGTRDGEDTDNSKYYSEQASASADAASTSETNAADSESKALEYAVGDTDSSKYYYEQSVAIAESLSGALRPMGTITFDELISLSSVNAGDMYNISDEFTTTDAFKEGAGYTIPLGSNVYMTTDGYWDVLAGSPVTGVKGVAEASYRRGNVEITLENLGIDGWEARIEATETALTDDVTEEDVDAIFE